MSRIPLQNFADLSNSWSRDTVFVAFDQVQNLWGSGFLSERLQLRKFRHAQVIPSARLRKLREKITFCRFQLGDYRFILGILDCCLKPPGFYLKSRTVCPMSLSS